MQYPAQFQDKYQLELEYHNTVFKFLNIYSF